MNSMGPSDNRFRKSLLVLLIGISQASPAEEAESLNQMEVIGTTPAHGVGLPLEMIPANVQSVGEFDLERSQSLDITEHMNKNLGSVNINAAQNNPLQPDVQFRGFTASPLLGLAQGVAVYQNGVRINEPLGDTVNWDLLPQSAISSINLISGANPIFGLNTLGGALSVELKNGFSFEGHALEGGGGTFGRRTLSVESGGNNGTLGYYINIHDFKEDGWRDLSESEATNIYTSFGYRSVDTTADLNLQRGNTDLRGNGAIPVELLAIDREAIFTAPDITSNEMTMVSAEATHWLQDAIQLSGNAFWRKNETSAFNGDATELVACTDDAGTGQVYAVEEDDVTDADADEDTCLTSLGEFAIADAVEGPFPAGFDFDAINNISGRVQESYGATAQATFTQDLFGRQNQLVVGISHRQGLSRFKSRTELASLDNSRSTDPTVSGPTVDDEATQVKTRTRSASFYITDTISVSDTVAVTLAGRYDNTRVVIGDLSGQEPELNGVNDYERFNPMAGVTWQAMPELNIYGSYAESSRAPTPIELACSEEVTQRTGEECRLPNAFLADPPLDMVVAKSFELGGRGQINGINWHLGGFHTTNEDDIIFQGGGATGAVGSFKNIGDTQRYGVEALFSGTVRQNIDWYLNYSFVHATFEDAFIGTTSEDHPGARDLDGDGGVDDIRVNGGNRIPGIPEHTVKLGADYYFDDQFTIGAEMVYNSDQYMRGDEANQLNTVDGHTVFNLRASYRFSDHVLIYAKVNNVFDKEYETFGLLGEEDEAAEVLEDVTNINSAVFLGPAPPRSAFVGMRLSF